MNEEKESEEFSKERGEDFRLKARLHPKGSSDGRKDGNNYLNDLFPDRRFLFHSSFLVERLEMRVESGENGGGYACQQTTDNGQQT